MTPERGAHSLTLDRPRIVFFDMPATWLLVERYGVNFARELYAVKGGDLTLKSMEALAYFLWAGLQSEARTLGETLTLEAVTVEIKPWTIASIFNAVVLALTGATATPPGKATGDAAKPAAEPSQKASTSSKRKDLRLVSSASRRKNSGR